MQLRSNQLRVQKRGLLISTFDSSYYSIEEEKKLEELSVKIKEVFKMRGSKTTKRQLLTSKEKDVLEYEIMWITLTVQNVRTTKMIDNKISLIREVLEEVN